MTTGRVVALLAGALAALEAVAVSGARAQELPEVLVTAEKRVESAQLVPITLTAIDAATFEGSQAKDLLQLANWLPGMVFSRAPDDGLALTIRGIGTPARTQAFDQSVAVFLDGLFLAKGRLYTQALFDLVSIDLIKGPQSTLLGKNTSAGALTLESREPGTVPSFEARAGHEAVHGGETIDAAADLPLNDVLAFRVAGHYNDTNGWVRNLATGREVPIDRDRGVRATGRLLAPGGGTATLVFQHGSDFRIGVPYQIVDDHLSPLYGEGVFNDQESELTERTPFRETTHSTDSNLVNLRLEWPLAAHTAVSQSGYVQYRLHFDDDFDFSNQPWTDFIRNESYSQLSEELRLLSPSGQRREYLVGVFLFHSRWHSIEQQLWGVPGFPPGTPIAGQLFNGPFIDDFAQDTDSQALFGQLSWHPAEQWQVSAGLRGTNERKNVLYGRSNAAPLTIWNTLANPPFPVTPLQFKSPFLDGNASVEWHMSVDAMSYATYSHGSKTGGFAETNSVPTGDPAQGARIGSEKTQSVELGIKSSWYAGSLRVNASLFYTDVKDFQDTTFTGTAFVTENVPLTSKGFDFESEWQALSGLRLGAAVTYADSFERPTAADVADGIRCSPCRATEAPFWNGSAHLEYRRALSQALLWGLSAHVRYRGAMFHQRGNLYPANAFVPVDLGLEIAAADERYGASLLAKNIANRLTRDFSSPSVAPYFSALASPAPLRTVTVIAWVKY